MGEKENRRRNQRRRIFYRDGWQDDHGDWFAMCATGCGAVLSFHSAGTRLRDKTIPGRPDGNIELVCKAGCNPQGALKIQARWRRQAAANAGQAVTHA